MSLSVAVAVGVLALACLALSAERAVELILALLQRHQLSATFGGLTILSILTSLPEVVAHLVASAGILQGTLDYEVASATVLGANIGSDVIQQTLVLGGLIVVMGGVTFERAFLLSAYLPMIGTTLLTLVLAWDRVLSRADGAILLGCFALYNLYLYTRERHEERPPVATDAHLEVPSYPLARGLGWFTLVLASAHALLLSTEAIVHHTGLGGSLLGVVVLGVASASPEMVTALSGHKRGEIGLSLGTLIGSNITNPLVAIGGGALLSTYHVPEALIWWDLPVETLSAALLFAYLLLKPNPRVLERAGGIYLMCLYAVYLTVRILWFSTDV
jgi:cation:H+ antiporter